MTAPWFTSRLAALDFETSGVNPHEAFIVTAHLSRLGGGQDAIPTDWVLSPGDLEIPAGATAIHGYSTDRARAEGVDHRAGVESVIDRIGEPGYFPVLDTIVLDRHVAPFRKRVSPTQGAYCLRTAAETYGLGWDEAEAHGAKYDALASARVAWRIGQVAHTAPDKRPDWVRRLRTQYFNDLAGLSLNELHKAQVGWAAEQAAGLQDFLRKSDPTAVVDGTWPVRTAAAS